MEPRGFNRIEIDKDNGVVTKRSDDRLKLKYEVLFYQNLDEPLGSMMPRLYGHAEDYSWYQMEYLDKVNLGDVLAYETPVSLDWEGIFKTLSNLLSVEVPNHLETTSDSLVSVLSTKSMIRAESLKNGEIRDVFFSGCTLNGVVIPPLISSLEGSKQIVSQLNSEITMLHGDMCFSNILVDVNSSELWLVDPRGGFSSPSKYGPAVYDIAKLSQSVYGLYEQVLAKNYSLSKDGGSYFLKIKRDAAYDEIEKSFVDSIKHFGIDVKTLVFLAGVMLSGTPPLHMDDEERALVLSLRASELIAGSQWR